MRKASSNWLGKIVMATVMGVLIVSFAVWGIADIFKGFGQSTLAKVGRTEQYLYAAVLAALLGVRLWYAERRRMRNWVARPREIA